MKVLLSWLREFAPFEADPPHLAETMSDLGMAVEDMQFLGAGLDGIVVAEVLRTRPHPRADRIQLVDVDAGAGEPLQICCGAFNMAPGDLVPLASLGTTMADGRLIERRKLRGEWSNGMLCSAEELGLGTDGSGILVLPEGLPPGEALAEALGLAGDVLYDLDLTGNRPDALSVAGVARDLAARLKLPFSLPEPRPAEAVGGPTAADRCRVELLAPDLCGRFAVRVLRGVSVGPSPAWLANRLVAVGQRPVNNVVDVSNYVMLELGQPSHTFDRGQVAGATLRVRWARDGERLVTLDGQERSLRPDDGVIADGDDVAISIAGVMGGRSTEISPATTEVLLEMAWWDPMAIARTSRRLGLRSEAATRFERGTDPLVAERAMARFAELLAPSSPVELLEGLVDAHGNWPGRARVRVRPERVNGLLGVQLRPEEMAELLRPIGFDVTMVGDPPPGDGPGAASATNESAPPTVLDVVVPSFRPDTTEEVDVIEEVARQYGYSRIPKTVPTSSRAGALTPRQQDRRLLRRTLVGLGLTEVMPLPFLAPGDLRRAGLDADAITVTNPLVAEESVLRTSLRPGLLKTLSYNASHRRPGGRLFELGHIYLPGADRTAELPDEREQLGVALAGAEAPAAVTVWGAIRAALAVADAGLVTAEVAGLHPTRAARIEVGGTAVGAVGEIDPAVAEEYGVGERVAWLELDLTTLLDLPHGDRPFRPFSRYPSSDLDLAFVVADGVPAAAVEATLRRAAGELATEVRLFDVFRGPSVGEGARSLAFRLRLQAADRTLTDAELADLRRRVVEAVTTEHGASLRG
jgi:phenylalanyl-tRNA synthetase beta chain